MRSPLLSILALALAACGSEAPRQTTNGPRLKAYLAATWPAEGPARQAAFSRNGRLLATSDATGAITIRETLEWKVTELLRHPNGATTVTFGVDGSHL